MNDVVQTFTCHCEVAYGYTTGVHMDHVMRDPLALAHIYINNNLVIMFCPLKWLYFNNV